MFDIWPFKLSGGLTHFARDGSFLQSFSLSIFAEGPPIQRLGLHVFLGPVIQFMSVIAEWYLLVLVATKENVSCACNYSKPEEKVILNRRFVKLEQLEDWEVKASRLERCHTHRYFFHIC